MMHRDPRSLFFFQVEIGKAYREIVRLQNHVARVVNYNKRNPTLNDNTGRLIWILIGSFSVGVINNEAVSHRVSLAHNP